jgi:hypothetical protein
MHLVGLAELAELAPLAGCDPAGGRMPKTLPGTGTGDSGNSCAQLRVGGRLGWAPCVWAGEHIFVFALGRWVRVGESHGINANVRFEGVLTRPNVRSSGAARPANVRSGGYDSSRQIP